MLIASLILFIFYNAVTEERDSTMFVSRKGFIIIIYSIFISFFNFYLRLLETSLSLFGGLFNISSIGYHFHAFIFILSCIIIGLICFYPNKIYSVNVNLINFFKNIIYTNKEIIVNNMGEQFKIIEYCLILLFIISGSLFFISSNDLISMFLSIELQSYGLYLISTIYRNSDFSTAAGLTYFLLGGLSSCFILLSTSLLYANSGTTSLDNLYILTTIFEINTFSFFIDNKHMSYYIYVSLIIMSVGLLFKVSAAPFHFWSPDVYDGLPTIVTTFVAILAKISIFIFLLELVHYTNKSIFNFDWTIVLLVSSLLSLIIGTILGISQSRIKRLYAYSTISHVGFILLALSIQSVESVQSFIFYIIQYSLSNLNAFILLLAIGISLYHNLNDTLRDENKQLKDLNNSPIQLISQLKGYFYLNPLLALSLSITLFSFIGVPPLIGFFAKQSILKSALDNGYVFMCLIAILTSVISAVYYLVIVKQLFFENIKQKKQQIQEKKNIYNFIGIVYSKDIGKKLYLNYNNIILSSYYSIIISILTLILLIFMFNNTFILNTTMLLTLTIFYN